MKLVSKLKKVFSLKKIIVFILIAAVGFSVYGFIKNKRTAQTVSRAVEYKVQRKDITVTLTGSGTVTQAYRQEISPYISGTVKKVYFKEGDKVKAGDLMIEFDDTPIEKTIERTRLNITEAQRKLAEAKQNIIDTTVRAPISGQIVNLTGNVGDEINKGAVIASIVDNSRLKLNVTFNKNQAKNFYIGQTAEVYLQDYMQTVSGKVSYVNKSGKAVSGGGIACDVEIIINNPGTITDGIIASAAVAGQMSLNSSKLEYYETRKVKCKPGGTIIGISVHENEQVIAGQELMKVENSDLQDTLLSCQMRLDDLQTQLESQLDEQEDYKITAPGSGTIVSQDVKAGDVVKQQDVISTIADNDSMEFDIDIDELDIDKVSVGMKAVVTFDALVGARYEGSVTQVATEGKSSGGVATYPVTIQIQNPKKVKAGMNANAEIVLQNKKDVLTLPIAAIQKMGNQAYVLVKGKTGAEGAVPGQVNNRSGANSNMNPAGNSRIQATMKALGENISMKRIQVGINNDTDIEIVSGLNEGDTVLALAVASSSNSSSRAVMMGGMGGPPSSMGGMGGPPSSMGGNRIRVSPGTRTNSR